MSTVALCFEPDEPRRTVARPADPDKRSARSRSAACGRSRHIAPTRPQDVGAEGPRAPSERRPGERKSLCDAHLAHTLDRAAAAEEAGAGRAAPAWHEIEDARSHVPRGNA